MNVRKFSRTVLRWRYLQRWLIFVIKRRIKKMKLKTWGRHWLHFWTCWLWNVLKKVTQTKGDSRVLSDSVGANFYSISEFYSTIFHKSIKKLPVDLMNLKKSLRLMMSARRVSYSFLFDFVQNFRPFSSLFGKNLMLSSRKLVYRMVLLTNRSRD